MAVKTPDKEPTPKPKAAPTKRGGGLPSKKAAKACFDECKGLADGSPEGNALAIKKLCEFLASCI